MVAFQVEYGNPALLRIGGDQGVRGPRFHEPQRPELPGALALARPGGQVVAGVVKHQHLIRTSVRDDDPAVGQSGRVADFVQLVVLVRRRGADGNARLRSDPPLEARTRRWAGARHDRDPGAVSDSVGELLRPVCGVRAFLTACDGADDQNPCECR